MELGKNHGFESLSHGSVFNSSIESKILSHLRVNNSNSQSRNLIGTEQIAQFGKQETHRHKSG